MRRGGGVMGGEKWSRGEVKLDAIDNTNNAGGGPKAAMQAVVAVNGAGWRWDGGSAMEWRSGGGSANRSGRQLLATAVLWRLGVSRSFAGESARGGVGRARKSVPGLGKNGEKREGAPRSIFIGSGRGEPGRNGTSVRGTPAWVSGGWRGQFLRERSGAGCGRKVEGTRVHASWDEGKRGSAGGVGGVANGWGGRRLGISPTGGTHLSAAQGRGGRRRQLGEAN